MFRRGSPTLWVTFADKRATIGRTSTHAVKFCDILVLLIEPSGLGIRLYTSIVRNEHCVRSHVDCCPTQKTPTLCHRHWFRPQNIGMLGSLSFEPSHPERLRSILTLVFGLGVVCVT